MQIFNDICNSVVRDVPLWKVFRIFDKNVSARTMKAKINLLTSQKTPTKNAFAQCAPRWKDDVTKDNIFTVCVVTSHFIRKDKNTKNFHFRHEKRNQDVAKPENQYSWSLPQDIQWATKVMNPAFPVFVMEVGSWLLWLTVPESRRTKILFLTACALTYIFTLIKKTFRWNTKTTRTIFSH